MVRLEDLIPNVDCNWVIRGNVLTYFKYTHVPVCYISDDIVFVYLDNKIHNVVLKLTKHLMKLGILFYFDCPSHSNPKSIFDPEMVIRSYFIAYSNVYYNKGFKKLEFDLMHNMVKWSELQKCEDLIKKCHEIVCKRVKRKGYDYYTNKDVYDYTQEMRDEFESLYREIQINKIL